MSKINQCPLKLLENISKLENTFSKCLSQVTTLNQFLLDASSCEMFKAFCLKTKPTVDITHYMTRMFLYMKCSPSVYVAALVFLDRVQQIHQPNLVLTDKNVHRITLAALLVAVKYLDDNYYKNSYYATVGGVSTAVLNELQLNFLLLLNFDLSIPVSTFKSYIDKLDAFIATSE